MNIKFMNLAFLEAKKAYLKNEIPVGAVLVQNNKILARAYNKKEHQNNVTAHAEILVIKKASKLLNNWRLLNCELYVTLKPCKMCMEAISQSRISKLIYVLDQEIYSNKKINIVKIDNIDLENKIKKLVSNFFKKTRTLKIKK